MSIREMSREESLPVLARVRFARLACAKENQPYIVPVTLAYFEPLPGEACLYGFTTRGQKLEWMRANPLVCVEVDEVKANDQWVSVIAFGRFEELPETPGSDDARLRAQESLREAAEAPRETPEGEGERFRAYRLLSTRAMWWEPGSSAWVARADRDPAEPYIPIYYKIRIDRLTGHESTRDAQGATASAGIAPAAGKLP